MEIAGLMELVALFGRLLAWMFGPVWRAYERVLNLPILIGVVIDCAVGVAYAGWTAFTTGSITTFLWAFALLLACAAFGIGSVFSWWEKVRLEDPPARVPVRVPPRPERRF